MRILLALILLAAPQAEDLEKKITALLEQIRDGDGPARERAESALAALGPPALPALRSRLTETDREVRLRIEQAIRRIERVVRMRARMGDVPLVTLAAGRPVRDALEDFNRQTGQNVTFRDVPVDATVAAAIQNVPCWSALDALCRGNGRLQWEPRMDGVVVRPGPSRDLPRVARGQFLFFIDRIIVDRWPENATLSIIPWLLWPAGKTPDAVRFRVAELSDDTGKDLRHEGLPRDDDEALLGSLDEASRRIGRRLWYWTAKAPDAKATKLEKFSGTVTVEYATEEVVGTIDTPESMIQKAEQVGGRAIRIESIRRMGERVRIMMEVKSPAANPAEIRQFALSGGKPKVRSRARGSSTQSGVVDGVKSEILECEFVFPATVEIAALELLKDVEVETVEIPFDFSGVVIR